MADQWGERGVEIQLSSRVLAIEPEEGRLQVEQLGLREPFDRLTLFFKNMALNQRGEVLPEVETAVKAQLFPYIANPQDCVWSRLLAPKDLQQLFLFPGGNLDHTMPGIKLLKAT